MFRLDSRGFLHLPRAARTIIIAVLCIGLLIGIGTIYYYLQGAGSKTGIVYNDAVLLGLSIVQLMLVGIVGAVIVMYGETDATTADLKRRSKDFLDIHLPNSLGRITLDPENRAQGCKVVKLGVSDIFGAGYELHSADMRLKLWVGINVSRLIVIYWIVNEGVDRENIEKVREAFKFTFGGAEKVGFATTFEPVNSPKGRPVISIWSAVRAEENLLTDPAARLFWSQDLAMMTESFWRTAVRNKIDISQEEPCPL